MIMCFSLRLELYIANLDVRSINLLIRKPRVAKFSIRWHLLLALIYPNSEVEGEVKYLNTDDKGVGLCFEGVKYNEHSGKMFAN